MTRTNSNRAERFEAIYGRENNICDTPQLGTFPKNEPERSKTGLLVPGTIGEDEKQERYESSLS